MIQSLLPQNLQCTTSQPYPSALHSGHDWVLTGLAKAWFMLTMPVGTAVAKAHDAGDKQLADIGPGRDIAEAFITIVKKAIFYMRAAQ